LAFGNLSTEPIPLQLVQDDVLRASQREPPGVRRVLQRVDSASVEGLQIEISPFEDEYI